MKARQRRLGKQNASTASIKVESVKEEPIEIKLKEEIKQEQRVSETNITTTPNENNENKMMLGPITKLIENDTKKLAQPTQGRKSRVNSKATRNSVKKLEQNLATPGSSSKEQQLSEMIKMFNFEISNDKIKLEENTEYYDMKVEIAELQNRIQQANKEYEYLCEQKENKSDSDNKQIEFLENILKQKIEENVEKVKTENRIVEEEIDSMEKKIIGLKSLYTKEEDNFNKFYDELNIMNTRLKNEIDYVNQLKKRIKDEKLIKL